MQPKPKYYPGQKNIPGLIQKIINQIPECLHFYELFAGSAQVSKIIAVGSMVPPQIHLNDIDPEVNKLLAVVPGATVSNKSAIEILNHFNLNPDVMEHGFVFLDPPYLHHTRPNSTTLYNHELTDLQHVQLLNAVIDAKYKVMLIHPDCELYNTMLCSFRKVQIKIRYHNKTSIENLYMNYPEPEKLCVTIYTGSNCWDRQRIKRRADKLILKLKAIPATERNYILQRITNEVINI